MEPKAMFMAGIQAGFPETQKAVRTILQRAFRRCAEAATSEELDAAMEQLGIARDMAYDTSCMMRTVNEYYKRPGNWDERYTMLTRMKAGPPPYSESAGTNRDQLDYACYELAACIAEDLTDKQRQAMEMYWFRRMTQEEIAEELGIAQQNVAKRLAAAARKLQKKVGPLLENRV